MWRLNLVSVMLMSGLLANHVSVCLAQSKDDSKPKIRHTETTAGIRHYSSQKWGMVAIEVTNPTDQPAELLAVMYFDGEPSLQYGRQLWVPARSKLASWYPVLPPSATSSPTISSPATSQPNLPGSRFPASDFYRSRPMSVEIKSLLMKRSGQTLTRIQGHSDQILQSTRLPTIHRRIVTAMISDVDESKPNVENAAYEAVIALRLNNGLSRRISMLEGDFLPPIVESLQGMDQLVLCSDRLAADAAALTAVRRWLYGGGRMWIMLDQVDPATVSLLLGDAFQCQVVDRVGLTHVLIKDATGGDRSADVQPRQFERPVDLVRVLATGVQVIHNVNGWPASFSQQAGRGRVLFTTLGPRAWIRPRSSDDRQPQSPSFSMMSPRGKMSGPNGRKRKPRDPSSFKSRPRRRQRRQLPRQAEVPDGGLFSSNFAATESASHLASELFSQPDQKALDPKQLEPFLTEQIGYRIVGRGTVLAVLFAFCCTLVVAGTMLARKKRLERLVWIGPLTAAAAATAFATLGMQSIHAVPPSIAVAQLVECVPGTQDVRISGLLAFYNQQESTAPLGVERDGMFELDMTGLDGTTRRMVWTDMDSYHWQNLTVPAGVRVAPFHYSSKLEQPIEARGRFGPGGLTGTVTTGPLGELADAVVATRSRQAMAVRLGGRGEFTAGPDEVLAPGQFIAGRLLSDAQRRRQSIYQQMLSGGGRTKYPADPTLLVWSRPLEMRFKFPDDMQRVGSALLSIPISIEPTPPGTHVLIPSPFLHYRSVPGPGQQLPSGSYDNMKDQWTERNEPSKSWLRLQLPASVLPFQVDRLDLAVEITGPAKKLEIVGLVGEKIVSLATRRDPRGLLRFQLDRGDALKLDEAGGLHLGVFVGDFQIATDSRVQSDETVQADNTVDANNVVDADGMAQMDVVKDYWKIETVQMEVTGQTVE